MLTGAPGVARLKCLDASLDGQLQPAPHQEEGWPQTRMSSLLMCSPEGQGRTP